MPEKNIYRDIAVNCLRSLRFKQRTGQLSPKQAETLAEIEAFFREHEPGVLDEASNTDEERAAK